MKPIKFLSWIGWTLLAFPLFAQSPAIEITTNFHGQAFPAFVSQVEKNYPLRFFFVDSWVDSLRVVQARSPILLQSLLESTLAGTDLYHHIDAAGNVILTPYPLQAQLPVYSAIPPPVASMPPGQNAYGPAGTGASASANAAAVIEIGNKNAESSERTTLSGTLLNRQNTEALIGASVFVEAIQAGVVTDNYGFYSLTLPRGLHVLTFRSYGMEEQKISVQLYGSGKLDVEMEYAIRQLDEVLIEAERDQNVSAAQMGMSRLDIAALKSMPAFMGEIDVIKSALLLPGVQSVGEGASGFNVRGGGADQNLILINQAPVFNPSHVFGFFSVFNPDLVKSFDLYKSGIPAHYGGRISSVLDIATKDGNKNKLSGSGGISPVTGRMMLEGPLLGKEHSFVVGARSTYSDWILNRMTVPELRNSSGGFYDLNAKVNFKLGENDRLDISSYYSRDRFRFNGDTTYAYANLNGSLSWKHLFNDRLYGVFSAIMSQYRFQVRDDARDNLSSFRLNYAIDYKEAKADFTYIPEPRHQLKAGSSQVFYGMQPGEMQARGDQSVVIPQTLERENAWEGSFYFSEEYDVSNRLKIYAGLRYSYYAFFGPKTVYEYAPNQPREEIYIIDSTRYGPGEAIRFYHGPEWRFSSRLRINEKSAVKFSITRMRQYLHMLSNTTSIAPTDTWKLSDYHIRPQVGDQVSLGLYHNLRQNSIETSVEVYYKWLQNLLEFKSGADLLLNPFVETDIINARGRAYGVEFLIRKERGKLNGWISYTLSRTGVQVDGKFPEERINFGEYYPANYDQPHNLSLVGNYKFNRRFSFSSNFTYNTGRPITYPVGQYQFGGANRLYYSLRNQYRIPDYYRWDISVNIEGNHRVKKLAHGSWSFSIFNVLGRNNAYSIYFVGDGSGIQGYKLSIFGQAIITLTYNFRF